jgi:hypothetical protein
MNEGEAMEGDVTTYADEHECGQLRIGVAGEQMPMLGLPDSAIPTHGGPARVDEAPPAVAEPIEGQTELLPDALVPSPRQIRTLSDDELRPFVDEIMRFSEPLRKAIAHEANKRAAARRTHYYEEV